MHVNGPLLDEHMVTPDLVEQARAAVHTLGVLHQVVQQLEFGGTEFEQLLVVGNAVG